MTREEAINYLDSSFAIGDDDDSRHHNEVLEFVIKALEQQPCEDCISRQAAIDALKEAYWDRNIQSAKDDPCIVDAMTDWAIRKIKGLPSAQPEQLTDKEQRIFLAAMAKEEKVCKQVDDECRDCREPYDDILVRTCHEIERKVKGALWT